MRVCMILEGSYPYVYGGVSSWMHQYIQAMPEVDFVLWCIGAQAGNRGHYKYELPENVVEVHEVFLDDALEQKLKMVEESYGSLRRRERSLRSFLRVRALTGTCFSSCFRIKRLIRSI